MRMKAIVRATSIAANVIGAVRYRRNSLNILTISFRAGEHFFSKSAHVSISRSLTADSSSRMGTPRATHANAKGNMGRSISCVSILSDVKDVKDVKICFLFVMTVTDGFGVYSFDVSSHDSIQILESLVGWRLTDHELGYVWQLEKKKTIYYRDVLELLRKGEYNR